MPLAQKNVEAYMFSILFPNFVPTPYHHGMRNPSKPSAKNASANISCMRVSQQAVAICWEHTM